MTAQKEPTKKDAAPPKEPEQKETVQATAPDAEDQGFTDEPGGKRKKRKKKFSRGFKGMQKGEVAISKGVSRLARAVDEGIWTWRRNRNKSSRKKRDGAIKDAIKNYGKALSKLNRVASKIPEDLTGNWPRLRKMWR
jgi:hypothetical protein